MSLIAIAIAITIISVSKLNNRLGHKHLQLNTRLEHMNRKSRAGGWKAHGISLLFSFHYTAWKLESSDLHGMLYHVIATTIQWASPWEGTASSAGGPHSFHHLGDTQGRIKSLGRQFASDPSQLRRARQEYQGSETRWHACQRYGDIWFCNWWIHNSTVAKPYIWVQLCKSIDHFNSVVRKVGNMCILPISNFFPIFKKKQPSMLIWKWGTLSILAVHQLSYFDNV